MVLDPKQGTFVIYVATLFQHPEQGVQIAVSIADKALIIVPAEYLDFKDVFSKKSAVVLSTHTKINTHAINLEEGKQSFYGPIYNLELVELEILKIYIKTNLANRFICSSKFLVAASILFDKKPNGNFWLCIYYQGLNNITIKN